MSQPDTVIRTADTCNCGCMSFDYSDHATKCPFYVAGKAARIAQKSESVDIEKKALANLLDAVEGFLWFSWADSDLDVDAARAIDRLRLARDEYGTVQRIKNGQ